MNFQPNDKVYVYKVRCKETGLFWRGGSYGSSYSKKGKTWGNIGHVKTALRQKYYRSPEGIVKFLENHDIIRLEINISPENIIPLSFSIKDNCWDNELC